MALSLSEISMDVPRTGGVPPPFKPPPLAARLPRGTFSILEAVAELLSDFDRISYAGLLALPGYKSGIDREDLALLMGHGLVRNHRQLELTPKGQRFLAEGDPDEYRAPSPSEISAGVAA
jgi:hypothetical protein